MEPFSMFVGPGFIDITAHIDANTVHVPFRVVGPPDAAVIEVYQPTGEVAWTYPAEDLLAILQRAVGRLR